MTTYKIDKTKCAGCGACIPVCPHGAITIDENRVAKIDYKKCKYCGRCIMACPFGAITKDKSQDID